MESRAAVVWAAGKPISIEQIEVTGPEASEVLVRIVATGANGCLPLPGQVERDLADEIRIEPMITQEVPLERIDEAFELMHDGKTVRSVIRDG